MSHSYIPGLAGEFVQVSREMYEYYQEFNIPYYSINKTHYEQWKANKPKDLNSDEIPDWLIHGEGNSMYDWLSSLKCECGSEKVYGVDCAANLHSDWCPLYCKE